MNIVPIFLREFSGCLNKKRPHRRKGWLCLLWGLGSAAGYWAGTAELVADYTKIYPSRQMFFQAA